jgi:hypothetical protein
MRLVHSGGTPHIRACVMGRPCRLVAVRIAVNQQPVLLALPCAKYEGEGLPIIRGASAKRLLTAVNADGPINETVAAMQRAGLVSS